MTKADDDLDAEPDVAALPDPAGELNEARPESPSGEVRSHRFLIRAAPGVGIDAETLRIAEFWLNVADGDALWALLVASERMSQIADRESFGFRRGRSPVMPTGLLKDEELP